MVTARSELRFPNLNGPSCAFHARQHIHCTPMDCEYYRQLPTKEESGKHVTKAAEAVESERNED